MKRASLAVFMCVVLSAGCGKDSSPTGPESVVGMSFQLVTINGGRLPVQYYSEPGYYSATAQSGNIVFLSNGRVRAIAHVRVHYDPPILPDEDVTTYDSVPYRVEGPHLLIERPHGWDTAQVNQGIRVHWTTSSGSMGQWLYQR